MDPLAWKAQVAGHETRVVVADGYEPVHRGRLPPDEVFCLGPPRLRQALKEQVFTLQAHADGQAQRSLERRGEGDEQRVGQDGEVETRQAGKPMDELLDLLALEAVVSLQHRHRQRSELRGIGGDRAGRGRADDGGGVPETIDQPRRLAKERHVLLEVDADAPEEHALAAHVALVGPRGGVEGNEQPRPPAGLELRRQRVVAQAAPAVHGPRPGGDGQQPHPIAATD